MKKTISLVLSIFSPPWCAVQFRSCSLRTSLQKWVLQHQTVSVIALEVSRNVLVLESPFVSRQCLGSYTGSPQKKKSLSLKDKKKGDIHFSFLSKEDELYLHEAFVPSNTKRSTNWPVKVFFDWMKSRRDAGEDECPNDLLVRDDPNNLVKWLSLFVAEARTVIGSYYSPPTLSQLLAGIWDQSIQLSKLFGQAWLCFKPLHSSLDNLFHKLRAINWCEAC